MAWRGAGRPGPGGYWLCPAGMAAIAASATSAGPSVSGKPCPRLIDPVRTARADISLKIVVVKGCRWAPMPLRIGPEARRTGSELRQLAPHRPAGMGVGVDVDVVGGGVADQLGRRVGREVDARLGLERRLARRERGPEIDHRPAC